MDQRDLPRHVDARTFTIPTADEVENYLIWRQQYATRNSVNMAAAATFPPASLDGLITDQQPPIFTQDRTYLAGLLTVGS